MTTQQPEKVLVIGAGGMLGHALAGRLGGRAIGVDRGWCDITDPVSVAAVLEEVAPQAVVNCAAWTDVDGAEAHPDAARALNADAVETLGRLTSERGIHLLTLSTDYVFTGRGEDPWPEDAPEEAYGPLSVYGRTKLEGERRLRALGADACIVRTQWLYGAQGKNFIDTIAALAAQRESLRVVDDQVGAPTCVEDLAGAIKTLLDHRAAGVYHCVNTGYVSWHGVASRVVERLGLACRVEPCATSEFPRPAARPANSRLSQAKFAALAGAPLRPWQEALDEYLGTK